VAGRAALVEPLGELPAPYSYPSAHWESGVSVWSELELRRAPDGALLVKATDCKDVHWAGRDDAPPRWFTSQDGITWRAVPPPADPGALLHQLTN
jgi:hypothetical protein